MKEHDEILNELDFVPYYDDISVDIAEGEVQEVTMHDGSTLRIKKLGREYDPTNKFDALKALDEAAKKGEVLTGVFYIDTHKSNFMEMLGMEEAPLATLPESKVRPPKELLDQVMEELR
jgi:2-oxoglutarate ferredoxin oxidoreductase subunit beta